MPVVVTLIAAAVLVWGVLGARKCSPLLLALATVVIGYVFGHAFWHARVGPLPVTLDRLALGGVAAAFAYRVWSQRTAASPWAAVDWALAAALGWLTFSAVASPSPGEAAAAASPLWRLLFSFWFPAGLYLVARQSSVGRRETTTLLAVLAGLGLYLAVTAIAETAGLWSLVFPRYIADPELGLHFGRARGPGLNSVSMGVYASICLWAGWLLLPRLPRAARVAAFATLPLMALAVLLTYTRSTWLGLALGGMAVLAMQLPRVIRWRVIGGVAAAGLLVGLAMWQSVLRLEREDTGGVSQHSVQQRQAFAYVSWQMFQDHPVLGVGFGRFYDQKLPYLADRTQSFELESLRELHHHNTFLCLLTETGLIGLAAYVGVLGGVLVAGWRLSQRTEAPPHLRRVGMLAVAAVMVYLPSALFHDLTLVHTDQWLLFLLAGVAVGCEQRLAAANAPATARSSAGDGSRRLGPLAPPTAVGG